MINLTKIKSERNLIFFKNTIYNYISTGLIIVLNLLLIPLLISVLGKEGFGVWQTILSIISLVSLLNFGLGNGLRNLITKLKIKDFNSDDNKNNQIGDAIGATLKKISAIIFIFSIVAIPVIYFFFDTSKLFLNVQIPTNEIRISIVIFLSFFCLNIILGLSNSIAYGLQKSYLTGIMQLSYLLLSYTLILILKSFYSLDLIHISFIFGASQSLIFIFFFFYLNRKFKLKINFSNNFDLKETTNLSFQFFLVQALSLIFMSVDNFVISSKIGPNFTAEYSVVNKIYFTLISIFSVLLIHFWNSVTDAFERKEFKWIFSTIRFLYGAAFIIFIIGLIIAFFQKSILHLWLGPNSFKITSITFYMFAFYALLHCINAIYVNIQNGMGYLRIQIFAISLALLLYGLGCYFIDLNYYGYNAIIFLKVVVISISIAINSSVLFKLKRI